MVDAFQLIKAEEANPEFKEKLMLYGQFVGKWEIKSTWFKKSGERIHANGEWHFSWILGGRGIQDVLFANPLTEDKYGTTIRCYDSKNDIWHVAWMQPALNEFANLIGRQNGNDIIQEVIGLEDHKEIWRFTDITKSSFKWRAEVSRDDGKTWFLQQEMIGKKVLAQ